MKKSFTTYLLILLLLSGSAFSQNYKSKWQVEASYDYMTHGDVIGMFILYDDFSELIIANGEKKTFYVAATRISPIKGRFAIRYGLSFSDKGYIQDFTYSNPQADGIWRWQTRRQHYYIGVPLLVSFNTLSPKKRLSAFAEAGIIPEVLIANNKRHEMPIAEILEYNFRKIGISGMLSAGLQYKLSESLMLVGGPQIRLALMDYDAGKESPISSIQAASGFRPLSVGFAVGLRF